MGARVFLNAARRSGLLHRWRAKRRFVREGLKTTLSELRLAKRHRSARARWNANVGAPSIFVISRERAKLGYFWRHAYGTPHSGPFHGSVVNPDTGKPILTSDDQLRRADFRK